MTEAARIESVGIVGGGFMGAGIAESVAAAGIPVTVRDTGEPELDRASDRIERSLERAVRGGKRDEAEAAASRERIELTTDWSPLAGADLVIEAVPEDLELKLEVMARLDRLVSEQALIASNTSSIPIAQLAGSIDDPGRMIGLHFFSPVPVMKLVEVVCALDTSEESVDRATEFCERIGKHPILTKDRSGFVVNMLLVPYLMAAVACTRRASPRARTSTRR